jgi:uncharacterized RDD family membrane protein YckC
MQCFLNTPNLHLHYYPYNDAPMPERVGFGRRFAATILDNLIIAIFALTLAFTFGSTILRLTKPNTDTTEFSIFTDNENDKDDSDEATPAERLLGMPNETFGVLVIANGIATVLYSLLELFTGASVGKRLLGMIIAADTGEAATRVLLAKRWWVKYGGYMFVLIPFLATIGSIWSFMITCGFVLTLGASRQALHDMAVHSAVFFKADIDENTSNAHSASQPHNSSFGQ